MSSEIGGMILSLAHRLDDEERAELGRLLWTQAEPEVSAAARTAAELRRGSVASRMSCRDGPASCRSRSTEGLARRAKHSHRRR